jgi:Kef-type K+ transport system membrane component KefB/nucleotide-binding universal stress UspA family protein
MDLVVHDPLTRFVAQIAAILVVSRLLGLGARAIGQPLVIAEITAGIVLGPSLLGWLAPEAYAVVFAEESLGVLQLVSQLGLVLFMFLVGLELDPTLLRGRAHTSVAISHTSIVVPFALGAAVAPFLHGMLAPEGVALLPFTLFLGAAMSITAFPVLARILTERLLLRSRIGAITIACAAVDDVTAWCLLAFVVATARASGLEGAMLTTAMALVYIAFMFVVVRPLLRKLAQRFASREALTQNVVALVLLCLFLSSWATELIGIHALFGAFLFGSVLPKDGGFAHALAEKLEDLVLVVLLPLFFAFSGVRTQIGLVDSASEWAICGFIIFIACLGKFGGSAIAARLTGMGWRESSAIGVLMNTRGLMELIVLNIGLDLGVISPTLFTMMVIMALVTTFMTTPILQLIYPAERLAREIMRAAESRQERVVEDRFTPLVCVAYDRTGPGLVTLAAAMRQPGRTAGPAFALNLVPPTNRASFYLGRTPEEISQTALTPALARARELAMPLKPISFVSNEPAQDICGVASAKGADLVLLGWHKPVIGQSMLAGIVHEVLEAAPCDVGVFIDRGLSRVQRVLVPFIGSMHDHAALALAQRLLHGSGAEITILHVKAPGESVGAGAAAADLVHQDGGSKVTLRVIEHASPADAALAESREGYDLLVVGVGREWGLSHKRFGVQPERLMAESPASVLVVRAGPDRIAGAQATGDDLQRIEPED